MTSGIEPIRRRACRLKVEGHCEQFSGNRAHYSNVPCASHKTCGVDLPNRAACQPRFVASALPEDLQSVIRRAPWLIVPARNFSSHLRANGVGLKKEKHTT